MKVKYTLFIPLFLLLFLVLYKKGEAFSHENTRHYFSKGKSDLVKNNTSSLSLIINPIESVPVINLRTYKTVHYAQHMFFAENDHLARLKHYNFFSRNGHNQNFTSQTTLLFPFHAFW
jgi:hypothetical protein